MPSAFRKVQEIVLVNYLEDGSTITGAYYAELMREVRLTVYNREEKLLRGMLFDDSAQSISHRTRQIGQQATSLCFRN